MKELTIPLESGGKVPLYEQIYQYIKQDILDGKISPGEKLPSTRLLAKYLQVSRSTTDLAYGQLLSEGYVRTVPGSGYYVCRIQHELLQLTGNGYGSPVRMDRWPAGSPIGGAFGWQGSVQSAGCDGVQGVVQSAGCDGIWGNVQSSEYDGVQRKPIRCDFSLEEVEWSGFSMTSWRKAVKCMLQEEMGGLFEAGIPQGEENLRQEIGRYLYQARGVSCQAQQIVIGAGNEYLLMLLDQMLPARAVAMESPTYRQAYQTFCNLGWEIAPVSMDAAGMRPKELKDSGANLAYIMPSHQFPLGTVMPMKRRMELLQWAAKAKERYIIEDDYDSEFRYKGKPIPSLQGSDPYGRVIYLGTFSKSIAPAIRVSYMVLPLELLAAYRTRCGFYSSTVSRIQQQILYHFMREGYFERHLNKMRRIYHSRHDALLQSLKGQSWARQIYGENAGLHMLVEVQTDKSEETIVRQAVQRQVRVYGLGEYSIRPKGDKAKPILLLGYARLTEEQIAEGIRRLQQAIEE